MLVDALWEMNWYRKLWVAAWCFIGTYCFLTGNGLAAGLALLGFSSELQLGLSEVTADRFKEIIQTQFAILEGVRKEMMGLIQQVKDKKE